MGAVHNLQEETVARIRMREMPDEVRGWICHHFGNSLCSVMGTLHYLNGKLNAGTIELPDKDAALLRNADAAAKHMAEDLEVIRRK